MSRTLTTVALAALLAACGPDTGQKPAAKRERAPHLVELIEARPGQLSYTADRSGSLRALREVRIINEEEGRVTELSVREGDAVRAGDVLVRYDDRILRAQLDKAAAARRQAEAEHERNRQMKIKGFVTEDALLRTATQFEVARAEERLLAARVQNTTLTAPFDGVVARRLADPGNATPRHTHLLTVIDPSQLVTDVTVSELVIPYLQVGAHAEVRIDALGAAQHPGRIVRIHPAIDPASRTGRVEVALDPVPAGARAGQFCRVALSTAIRDQLIVPLSAVQRDTEGEYVLVYGSGGTVSRRGVQSGLRLADRVEIRGGLSAGDRVVTKGFIGLKPGQKVTPVGGDGSARGDDKRGTKPEARKPGAGKPAAAPPKPRP